MAKDDRHALVWYGSARINLGNRFTLTKHFRGTKGSLIDVRRSRAPGIHFGFMNDDDNNADNGKLLVFRIKDVTLNNEIRVEWNRLGLVGGVSPAGKRITERAARILIDEACAANPG